MTDHSVAPPTGEAQPVAWQYRYKPTNGQWRASRSIPTFMREDKRWEVQPLYAALPDQHGDRKDLLQPEQIRKWGYLRVVPDDERTPEERLLHHLCRDYLTLWDQHGEPTRNEEVARAKAAQLLALEENWDTYGAPKITADAVDAALRLREAMATEPSLVPMGSGGVQLEWHTHGFDVELALRPDGSLEEVEHGEPTETMVERAAIAWCRGKAWDWDKDCSEAEKTVIRNDIRPWLRAALTTKRGAEKTS